MDVSARIEREGLIVVLRGMDTRACIRVAEALVEGGVTTFEVTMNSPGAVESIRDLVRRFGDAAVGAGTVTRASEVDLVADAGATYVVSPHVDPAVVRRTKDLGLVSIPGALTPTEVVMARDAGADFVKIFPIATVGASYLKHLAGPLHGVKFVATGGVTLEMIPALRSAGSCAVGLGLHLMGVNVATLEGLDALPGNAKAFREATSGGR